MGAFAPTSYAVQPGDSWRAIAFMFTGDAERWPELGPVNSYYVDAGGHFDPLVPGDLLELPDSWPEAPVYPPPPPFPGEPAPDASGLGDSNAPADIVGDCQPTASAKPSASDLARYVYDGRAALMQAAREQQATVTPQGARLFLAVVVQESGFGRFGTMTGTHNWGAYQCTDAWRKKIAGRPGYGCFPHPDRHKDGSVYTGYYRKYPGQSAAARDWFGAMMRWGLLDAANSGDAAELAGSMFDRGYYEGTQGGDREKSVAAYVGFMGGGLRIVDVAFAKPRPPDPAPADDGAGALLVAGLAVGAALLAGGSK